MPKKNPSQAGDGVILSESRPQRPQRDTMHVLIFRPLSLHHIHANGAARDSNGGGGPRVGGGAVRSKVRVIMPVSEFRDENWISRKKKKRVQISPGSCCAHCRQQKDYILIHKYFALFSERDGSSSKDVA